MGASATHHCVLPSTPENQDFLPEGDSRHHAVPSEESSAWLGENK